MHIITAISKSLGSNLQVVYPNFKQKNTGDKFEDYLKTALTLFWSCREAGYEGKLSLFTNVNDLKTAYPFIFKSFTSLSVDIEPLSFEKFAPNPLICRRFSLNFYKLEALWHCSCNMPDDTYIYLDSDCLVNRSFFIKEKISLYRIYKQKDLDEDKTKTEFIVNVLVRCV